MGGFLRNFDEEGLLGQMVPEYIRQQGYKQGLHLAMLGISQQAHAIFELLHRHKLDPISFRGQKTAIRFFYHVSGLKSPFEDEGEDEDIQSVQRDAIRQQSDYVYSNRGNQPNQNVDLSMVAEERYEELNSLATQVVNEQNNQSSLPQILMCLAYAAHVLGRDADMQHYFITMANLINDRWQVETFAVLLIAWEKFFLTGGLRDAFGLQVPQLSDYGDFVLRTLTRRLEGGPVHPDHMYAGKTTRELVDELDRNTMSDPEFNRYDWWFSDENGGPKTVWKKPATDEAIAVAEEKIGRELPEQLKAFLKLTNGLHHVKAGPGFRSMKFVAVEDMYLEGDEYMEDYNFSLLPDFEVESKKEEKDGNDATQNDDDSKAENEEENKEEDGKDEIGNEELGGKADGDGDSDTRKDETELDTDIVDKAAEDEKEVEDDDDDDDSLEVAWLQYSDGGGIAMYEHDGQGTEYTWIIPKAGVDAARARLATVYARVDDEQKRRIDRAILHRFGSREAYDRMEYCIWVQMWGDPNGQEVHPSFESYLRWCVYESRTPMERSPMSSST